jgi:hypothetical protein
MGAATCGAMARHQAQLGRQLPAVLELSGIAYCRHQGGSDQRTHTFDLRQSPGSVGLGGTAVRYVARIGAGAPR